MMSDGLFDQRGKGSGFVRRMNDTPPKKSRLGLREIAFTANVNNVVGSFADAKFDVVFSDDVQGSHDVTRYLISLGHRHIWFVGNIGLPWLAMLRWIPTGDGGSGSGAAS